MPSLAEILETLAWYRPLETILSDEGIVVVKISETEMRISIGEVTRTIKAVILPASTPSF